MAKRYYQRTDGGATISIWQDPTVRIKTDLEDSLPALEEVRALSDDVRTAIAIVGVPSYGVPAFASLPDFDDWLDDTIDRTRDMLDYFDYDARDKILTVRDGAWFTPEALESVSDEIVGNEGALAIDGENATYWQSEAAGVRSIVFRLRGYRKRIERLRLRTNETDLRSQLQGVTIALSRGLGMIDDPGNVAATGVDFTWAGNGWTEHIFASPKRARYIKLEVSGALHANADHVRIREIAARVGITNHEL